MCNCLKTPIETEQYPQNYSAQDQSYHSNVLFKYIGNTALTLIGTNTSRRYRFEKPGDVQLIEAEDIMGILHIPVLARA